MSSVYKCRLCEIELTNTAILQIHDKHCIRIRNLIERNLRKLPYREGCMEEKAILYHINRDNGRIYNPVVVPKQFVPTILKEIHDRFGYFGIGKT